MLKKEFIRFIFVGCANTATSYLVYLFFNLFLSYRIAFTVGYLAGLLLSYFLHANWVFNKGASWKSLALFPLVYVIQYTMSIFLLGYIVETLNVNENIAFVPVVIVTIPITFLLSKYLFHFIGKK